ncbi:hypothetical protein PsYK624_110420 [Phanerochaete sordida]|uniref:DUF7918 domain-containing protein n=1 Tax=Phanerochaete sordida TaxID=48140 RepID=A0A9P3GH65_9APHY|nr:hypothetical protein PsYK624_110420 [Phanerochaete sordida]
METAENAIGPVHERSKKAGVHCVSFGRERRVGGTSHGVSCTYRDTLDQPYCKFVFRYRSRDMLLGEFRVRF